MHHYRSENVPLYLGDTKEIDILQSWWKDSGFCRVDHWLGVNHQVIYPEAPSIIAGLGPTDSRLIAHIDLLLSYACKLPCTDKDTAERNS